MYELNSRVRYSETDIDAKLSLTGIMNYMQDLSLIHIWSTRAVSRQVLRSTPG